MEIGMIIIAVSIIAALAAGLFEDWLGDPPAIVFTGFIVSMIGVVAGISAALAAVSATQVTLAIFVLFISAITLLFSVIRMVFDWHVFSRRHF